MKKLLKEYRVALIALLIISLGIFLLVEQFEIRASIFRGFESLRTSLGQWFETGWSNLVNFVTKSTLSDMLGWILITVTLIFILWRVRYRFLRSSYWRTTTCPNCGGSLERIPRKRVHHIISAILLPGGRRYKCTNSECKWNGMRHRHRLTRSDGELKQFPPEGQFPY